LPCFLGFALMVARYSKNFCDDGDPIEKLLTSPPGGPRGTRERVTVQEGP
jgi:hypothetical protein